MNEQELKVEDLKPIEAGEQLDVSEYEGKKAKIETIETIEMDSNYGDGFTNVDGKVYDSGEELPKGKTIKATVLKITTEKLGEVKTKEGMKDIRASEIFSLKRLSDGSWGWSTHVKAKLMKLYKRLGIADPNLNPYQVLKGKQVCVVVRPGKEDTSWLGILV